MIKIEKSKKLSHLSFKIKKFLQFYPWKDCAPIQFKNLDKKLRECNVAIVSSAGFVVKNKQKPFDINDKFGDSSYRVIPSNINSYVDQKNEWILLGPVLLNKNFIYLKSNVFIYKAILNKTDKPFYLAIDCNNSKLNLTKGKAKWSRSWVSPKYPFEYALLKKSCN